MDKLLDKEMHQLYKAPSLSTYLHSSKQQASAAEKQAASSSLASANLQPAPHGGATVAGAVGGMGAPPQPPSAVSRSGAMQQFRAGDHHRKSPSSGCESDDNLSLRGGAGAMQGAAALVTGAFLSYK